MDIADVGQNYAVQIKPKALQTLVKDVHSEYSTITCIRSCGGKSSGSADRFLDTLLSTDLCHDRRPLDCVIGADLAITRDALVLAKQPRQLVVLNLRAGPSVPEEQVHAANAFSLSMSDVVLMPVMMHSADRDESSGRSELGVATQQILRLVEKAALAKSKKKLLVIVRDYDSEEATRDEVIAVFLRGLEKVISSIQLPSGASAPRASDLFDTEFVFLPHSVFQREKYEEELESLRGRLLDPAVDDYLFPQSAFASTMPITELEQHAISTSKALHSEIYGAADAIDKASAALGGGKEEEWEMEIAYTIEHIRKKVEQHYDDKTKEWRMQAEAGRIIREFGTEGEKVMHHVLADFDAKCSEACGTKAQKNSVVHKVMERKRQELKDTVSLNLYALYSRQLVKLREVAFEVFREKVDHIQVTESIERDIEAAIRETDQFFVSKASQMRVSGVTPVWSFDSERKELMNVVRESGTERIQFARIQGEYNPPSRQPIGVSFHYMAPSAFGWKDSRYESLSGEVGARFSNKDSYTDALKAKSAGLPSKKDLIFSEPAAR